MTSNIDRAVEVIGGWIDAYLPHSEDNFGADEDIARALADAGLLALETLAHQDTDPAHIHAAVAEAVRLRRKIIALRDSYAAPDDPGDDYGRGAESAYQIAARDLTRILEGEA